MNKKISIVGLGTRSSSSFAGQGNGQKLLNMTAASMVGPQKTNECVINVEGQMEEEGGQKFKHKVQLPAN